MAIRASEELQREVSAVKSGNTLKLSLKSNVFHARPIVHALISMPQLNKLRFGGAVNGTVSGFTSGESRVSTCQVTASWDAEVTARTLKALVSGASRLTGRMLRENAEFVLSGASRLALTSTGKDVVMTAWGASKAETEGFKVENAKVLLRGASEATVNATGQMDLDLSGGSRLTYSGNPAIHNIAATGASSLNHK